MSCVLEEGRLARGPRVGRVVKTKRETACERAHRTVTAKAKEVHRRSLSQRSETQSAPCRRDVLSSRRRRSGRKALENLLGWLRHYASPTTRRAVREDVDGGSGQASVMASDHD